MGTSTRDRMINDAMRMTYEDNKLTIWDKSGNELMSCIIEGGGGGGSTVKWSQIQTTGTKIATITINGTPTDVYAPTGGGTDVRYEPGLLAGPLVGTLYLNNVPYELHCSEGGGGGSEVSWIQYTTEGTKIARIMVDGYGTDVYAPSGGGEEVIWTQYVTEGTKIARISIGGQGTDIYAPAGGGSGSVIWTPETFTIPSSKIGVLKIDSVSHDIEIPSYAWEKCLKVDGSRMMEGNLHMASHSIDTCSSIIIEDIDPSVWGIRMVDMGKDAHATILGSATAGTMDLKVKVSNDTVESYSELIIPAVKDPDWYGPAYHHMEHGGGFEMHLLTEMDGDVRYIKSPAVKPLEMNTWPVLETRLENTYANDLTIVRKPSSHGSDGCKLLMSDHLLTLYVGNDDGSNFTALRLKGDPTGSSEVPYRPVVVHAFGSLEYETGIMLQTDLPSEAGNTDRPVYIKDNAFIVADKYASGTRVFFNGESKAGDTCSVYGPERMGRTGEVLTGLNNAAAQWEDKAIIKVEELIIGPYTVSAQGANRITGVDTPAYEGYKLRGVLGATCNSWEILCVAKQSNDTQIELSLGNVSTTERSGSLWIRLLYVKKGWC